MRQNGCIIADDAVIAYKDQFWEEEIGCHLPGKTDILSHSHADQPVEPAFERQARRVAGEQNHQAIAYDLGGGNGVMPQDQRVALIGRGGDA